MGTRMGVELMRASLQVSGDARESFPLQSEMNPMRAGFLNRHCDHLAKLLASTLDPRAYFRVSLVASN